MIDQAKKVKQGECIYHFEKNVKFKLTNNMKKFFINRDLHMMQHTMKTKSIWNIRYETRTENDDNTYTLVFVHF